MIDLVKEEEASRLRGSLMEFTKFFTKHVTNRDYIESRPECRESHQIIICRELTSFARLEHPDENLLMNVEPGSGKTLHLCMFVAWCYTHNDKCNFIYVSHSQTLSAENTGFIRLIMTSRIYEYLFNVYISKDTRAKDHFATTAGGHVAAFGSAGAITGRNAGLPGQNIFSGAVIIDDAHKPDEAFSDTMRENVIRNYENTIRQRPRGNNVPIIFIGQRVHEADLASFFIENKDTKKWRKVILKSLDEAGNALYPEVHSKEYLLELQEKSPYVFYSQFQQNPTPAGGSLFRPEWFLELEKEPTFISTFITADTAETGKNYNDPSAFSFFGLYEIEVFGKKTGQLGLHWIDCLEDWIEAKDLQDRFIDFWRECSHHKMPPLIAAIEKKSTGVTLIGALNNMQGLKIKDVLRTAASGSKAARYIEMQPFIASKRVTFSIGAKHIQKCKLHMSKITSNDAHRHDDICLVGDTLIATQFGDKKIKDVKINDKVITPFGYASVIASSMTGRRCTINRFGIEGTGNHPIFYQNKFERLDAINDGNKIDKLSLNGLVKWRYKKLLNSMVLPTGSWVGRDAIILVNQIPIKKGKILKDCMWQFGNFIAERKYLMGGSFIIKTMILSIMSIVIWNVYLASNILKNMQNYVVNVLIPRKRLNIWQGLGLKLKRGMQAILGEIGIGRMLENQHPKYSMNVNLCVWNALNDSLPENQRQNIAVIPVERESIEEEKEVYNLTIQHDGVYYANNVLTSNCDTLYDGIKIALIDKILYNIQSTKTNADDVMKEIANQMRRQRIVRMNRDGIR